MKKIYQIPELEVFFIEEFCQTINEGQSENNGEIVNPTANQNNTFDENDIVKDVTTPTTLWDE